MNTFKVLTASSLIAATVITATAPISSTVDAKGVTKTTKSAAKVKQCSKTPKNVILMIGDGMGISQLGAYRYYKDNAKKPGLDRISFDNYLVGSNITISDDPDENITDSGAAGTALATGHKTYNGAISVDKNGKSVETVLEAWKKAGKSTGLIATSELTHATPAVFSAHNKTRKDEMGIAVDQTRTLKVKGKKVHLVDVMLGGGVDFYKQKGEDGKIKTDLVKKLQKSGYSYVTTRNQMLKDNKKQTIGLFAPSAMAKDIDRPATEPSLKEMTDTAIKKLSTNKDGFFLMVEGSQPDWAGHANDLTGMMSEISAFDKAFQSAINYAKKDCNTLVVALADHATGGLSVGTGEKYLFDPSVVKNMKMTAEGLSTKMVQDGADINKLMADNIKFELTSEEKQAIVDAANSKDQKKTMFAINKAVDTRANAAWGSLVHTGEEIHVYAYGPGKTKFMGVQDNTQVAKNIFSYVGIKK